MPVLFNLFAHLALGALLARNAKGSRAFRDGAVSWPLIILVAFNATLAAPAATFQFRFFPQWSLLYAFDPQVFPGLEGWIAPLSALVVMANLFAGVVGLLLSRAGTNHDSRMAERAPWIVASVGFFTSLILYGERALWAGTYDAYWQDQARFFLVSPAGWAGLLQYGAGITLLLWVKNRLSGREPSYI